MDKKTLLCIGTILLIATVDFAYGNPDDNDEYGYDDSSKNQYHDGGMDGYHGKSNKVIGHDGIDPRKDGTDIGDYGPVRSRSGPPMLESLNIWISSADDWDSKGSGKYRGKGSKYGNNGKYNQNGDKGGKYNQNDDYNDNDYKGGRNKRSYKKFNFPVKQIKNYKKFPFSLFPPLISIAPWVPIFYDKLTYQTFIFSLQGGIIIIPPLINFYGQRFAVAQLIKWGYASLVSSGAPPPPGLNVGPLIGGGVVAGGVAGGAAPAGGAATSAPTYNTKTNQFNGAVKTDLPSFRPRPNYLQEGYNNAAAAPPANSPKYSS